MISEPRKTGLIGEIRAAQYLRKKGYVIYNANFKSKAGEIDIIADDGKTICFVEVKTRTSGGYFDPGEAVDYKKEQNVRSTAAAFMSATKIDKPIRFDIIEIVFCENSYKIRHTENAF